MGVERLVSSSAALLVFSSSSVSQFPRIISTRIYLNPSLPDICVIIKRYVEQLEDEQAYKNDFGLNKKNKKTNPSYYPFQSIESNRGLLNHKK